MARITLILALRGLVVGHVQLVRRIEPWRIPKRIVRGGGEGKGRAGIGGTLPTAAVLMLILQVSSSVQNAMRPTMDWLLSPPLRTALVPLLPLASGGG